MRPKFAAHTPPEHSDQWHDLEQHLRDVAAGSQSKADKFAAGALGEYAGLWHDLGKYNPEFQTYLDRCHAASQSHEPRKPVGSPHAIYGAKLAWDLLRQTPLAPIIYGHHAGLPEINQIKSKLVDPALDKTYQKVLAQAQQELGELKPEADFNSMMRSLVRDTHGYELLTRLLFSCLVDSDYLDTEEHFDAQKTAQREATVSISELWPQLKADQTELLDAAKVFPNLVNQVRAEVYDACLTAAELAPGVFRLAVPTGGGKTRSGLAFALKTCRTTWA